MKHSELRDGLKVKIKPRPLVRQTYARRIERPTAGEHLIGLIKQQDTNSLGWVKFFVALEGALFAAIAALNKVPTTGSKLMVDPFFSILALPLFGIVLAVLLERIMVRERRWQAWYVQQFRAHSSHGSQVFPADGSVPKDRIGDLPLGRISKLLSYAARVVILMWLIILMAIVDGRWGVFTAAWSSLIANR